MIFAYVIVFVCGFCLMALEILGGRALAPYFGFTLHVWGAVIAVFLAALSVGYAAGERLGGLGFGRRGLLLPQGLVVIILGFYPFYGPRFCEAVFAAGFGPRWGALLASALLFVLPSMALGSVPSYLVGMSATEGFQSKARAGDIFAVSTLGGIAGTLGVAFYLVELLGTSTGIQLLSIPLAVNCLICLRGR